MCDPIKAKTGGIPLGGAPGRRPEGPRSRSTHGARRVPGTSQASAEAENDEVAIFSGAFGQLSLCWSGGCAATPTGYFFSRGRGGPAGPLCPVSVCVSVTPADRKNQPFREICHLVSAEQTLKRAQSARFFSCAKIHHRCSQRRFLCAKSCILRAQTAARRFSEFVCNLKPKRGGPPLEGPLKPAQEGPGAARRTEQDAFLAHPRQVRRLKMMK